MLMLPEEISRRAYDKVASSLRVCLHVTSDRFARISSIENNEILFPDSVCGIKEMAIGANMDIGRIDSLSSFVKLDAVWE